jgi:hypothetical protein
MPTCLPRIKGQTRPLDDTGLLVLMTGIGVGITATLFWMALVWFIAR